MGAQFGARGVPAGEECAPIGIPEAVGVCAMGMVDHGAKLHRSCGRAHLHGLKRSARVGLCASLTPYIYIIGENKLF